MEQWKQYKVNPNDLEKTLIELGKRDFEWEDSFKNASPMSVHFLNAINRDWEGHIPVLRVADFIGEDTGKRYKRITLTSDLLLKANNNTETIFEYEDLCRDLNFN